MKRLLIACADIGSVVNGNFGWADSEGSEGTKPSELAAKVASALADQRPVALGFAAPYSSRCPTQSWNWDGAGAVKAAAPGQLTCP